MANSRKRKRNAYGHEGSNGDNEGAQPGAQVKEEGATSRSVRQKTCITERLLQRFYGTVAPLTTYLKQVIKADDEDALQRCIAEWQVLQAARQDKTAPTARKLNAPLLGALVGTNHAPQSPLSIARPWQDKGVFNGDEADAQVNVYMTEVVEEAQGFHMRNSLGNKMRSNMLTLGYREPDDVSNHRRAHKMLGGVAATSVYANPYPAQVLLQRDWMILTKFLGLEVLRHLLHDISLFLPTCDGGSNYHQVLGLHLGQARELSQESTSTSADSVTGPPRQEKRRRRRKPKRSTDPDAIERDEATIPANTENPAQRNFAKWPSSSANNISNERRPSLKKPSTIALLRQRMFYARPQKTRSGKIAAGLPPGHILNCLNLPREKQTKASSLLKVDCRELKSRSRQLAKHIFPLEYGLSTTLRTTSQTQKKSLLDLTDNVASRDKEISEKGKQRTPERLHQAMHLLRIVIVKHSRLNYRRLLDNTCRRSLPRHRLTDKEREEIVESLCEVQPSQMFTQAAANQTHLGGPSQRPIACVGDGSSNSNEKPRFAKYKAPQGSVSLFAQLVLRIILPVELLGSHANFRLFFKKVDRFVKMRRYETVNLHQLFQGFQILDCTWLLPRNKRALHQRPNAAEMQKRREIVYQLLFFIFDSILIPLLRTTFYATESSKFRNRVLYFRQDDWSVIAQPIFNCLKDECFERIPKHKAVAIMSQRNFGYSFIRLLPKDVGMRPIINLRRRSVKIERSVSIPEKSHNQRDVHEWGQHVRQNQSINNVLSTLFNVLSYERNTDRLLAGSSVSGPQDIHSRLMQYKCHISRHFGEKMPKFYFVKVDVAGAFDCVNQAKLMEIAETLLKHDIYATRRFLQVSLRGGLAHKKWCTEAQPEAGNDCFSAFVNQISNKKDLDGTLFCDTVKQGHNDRSRLLWLLQEHITHNLVKIGREFCVQKVGIPQGSTLSTLLCCFYLGKLEAELGLPGAHLSLDSKTQDCLMRYTDDFLYITTDIEKAHQFLQVMQAGSETFNCYIAPGKTMVNFDVDTFAHLNNNAVSQKQVENPSLTHVRGTQFPWCSYLINVRDLSVQYDLSRYKFASMSDSLTIPNRSPYGSLLKHLLASTIQRRNVPIFLDTRLNSLDTIYLNIYESFVLAALKITSALRALLRSSLNKRPAALAQMDEMLSRNIEGDITHCYAHAKGKLRRQMKSWKESHFHSIGETNNPEWPVDFVTYEHLALHAIVSVLELRPETKRMQLKIHLSKRLRRTTLHLKAQTARVGSKRTPSYAHTRMLIKQSWRQMASIIRTISAD